MAQRIKAISSDDADNMIVEINGEWKRFTVLLAESTPEDAQDYRNQVESILVNARRFLTLKPPEANEPDPRRVRPL
jgi:hypothetical protein